MISNKQNNRKRPSLFVLCTWVVASALLALLFACQKAPDSALQKATRDLGTRRPANMQMVRFLPQWHHQAQFAGVYVAKAKGFYEDFGIDVIIQSGGPQAPAAASLVNGSTDISTLFLLTALSNRDQGNNLINIAQVSQKSSLMLVAKRDKGINAISDLNHKKIALWRTDFRDLSLIFFKQHQLDVTIVPIDWSINLFLNGPVDAMNVMLYNEYHLLYQAGLDYKELFAIPYSDVGLNIVEDGIYVTEDYYINNSRLCKDFAEATMNGWLYAINNREEAINIVLDIMRRDHLPANRAHQQWMLDKMREVILAKEGVVGTLQRSSFEEAQNLMLENGLLKTTTPYERFAPNATQN